MSRLLLASLLAAALAAGAASAQTVLGKTLDKEPLDAPAAEAPETAVEAPAVDAPAETDSAQPEPAPGQETSWGEGDQGLPNVSAEDLGVATVIMEGVAEARDILGDAFWQLPPNDFREAVLLGILRAADPGLRVLSRGEWEAERDSAELSLADAVATEDFPARIGYAKVAALVPGAGQPVVDALRRWESESFHGAILDLRGAGGTDEASATAVASLLVKPPAAPGENALLYSAASGGEVAKMGAFSAESYSLPVVVLVDESTRGAAELLAAVLKGSCKGTLLVGETTAADPCLRTPHDLADDRVLLVATRKIAVADGTEYTGAVGIVPDVVLAPADRVVEVSESNNPISMRRVKRGELEEEREDRALRDRVGTDGYLIRAVDILQGLHAIAR